MIFNIKIFLIIILLIINSFHLDYCMNANNLTEDAHLVIQDEESTATLNGKIAFLFLSRGAIPLEDIWREFFNWRGNPNHYSIYVHPHRNYKFGTTSLFYKKEITTNDDVKWGGMSQVKAIKNLVTAALEDPLNIWFVLMSESDIPLHPFPKFRSILLANTKSIINACAMSPSEMELDTRWRPSLDKIGMVKSQWRKSGTWFALNKLHAQIFSNEKKLEPGWEGVPCCDEHYLPSILAYYGQDNATTCSDGFVHVYWSSLMDSHPHTWATDEINVDLFARFTQSQGGGFGMMCSGYKEVCHFTARKFSGGSKFHLLENIDLILSEDEHPYEGNPFAHMESVLRYKNKEKIDSNILNSGNELNIIDNRIYFLIEDGKLRLIPDEVTLGFLHLHTAYSKEITDLEYEIYEIGPPFPSRQDGRFIKKHKNNWVFLMKDGKRHGIPNMDTLNKLGATVANIQHVSDFDLEQIPMGTDIPPCTDC